MDTGWSQPKRILAALERRAERRVLLDSLALQPDAPVEVVRVEADRLLVRSCILEEDGGKRFPLLEVGPSRIDGRCTCARDAWPCRHLLALARAWVEEGEPGADAAPGPGGWRAVLERLAPRRARPVAEVGQHILVHWLALEQRAGRWQLTLSWRSHRLRARGIGRGSALAPAAVLSDPPAGAGPADVRVLARVAASGARIPAGRGADVAVPPAAVDAVLRDLWRAGWVQWADVREPVGFELRPVAVHLLAEKAGGGLVLRCRWTELDGAPWAATSPRAFGQGPAWVAGDGVVRPVWAVQDGAALETLAASELRVPDAEVSVFLGSVVPDLEARGVAVEFHGIEERSLVVREGPQPRLYLSEESGVLVADLRFGYGDFEVLAENPEPVLAVEVAAGSKGYLRRDMEAEFRAVGRLRECGLRLAEPGRFEIEGDAALDFLTRDLEVLAQEWPVYGREGLANHRVTQRAVAVALRVVPKTDWLEVTTELQTDAATVPPDEVLRALRRGGRYVRLGDGSHARLPEDWLRRVRPALAEFGYAEGGARVPTYMAPVLEELDVLGDSVEAVANPDWERLLEALHDRSALPQIPVPSALAGSLRPYQVTGYRWLHHMTEHGFGCVLADDMGLGKTVQTIALLLRAAEQEAPGPSLVVAPTSVVPNWEAELERFAPGLGFVRYHGSERRDLEGDLRACPVVVTSYAILRRDIEVLRAIRWHAVVLDESQAIKNAGTQTARCARALQAERRIALTGTPLENHLGELWSQFQFLMPGLLGTEGEFARRFARPIAQGEDDVRTSLRRRVGPFILRRMKSEVERDLPPKVESLLWCEMAEDQERLYRSLLLASRERVFREVEKKGLARARFSVLESLLRLRQVCCHPQLLPGDLGQGVTSAKFDLFQDFVREVVDEGHRVLVFSQFVRILTLLRSWFEEAQIPHLYLDGRTRKREEKVRRFQEDPSIAAFLVSLKAGGTGLNLTGADYVVMFDPWWNPAVERQATDRAHRIGQTRKVFAYKMITRGTVEEKILALQERKKQLTEDLIQSEGAWGRLVTEEDLELLFGD